MGKRSSFERVPRDFYPTPKEAVLPLLPHLPGGSSFVEPCAGDGRLIDHLVEAGHRCVFAGDLEPRRSDIVELDVLAVPRMRAHYYITNPPWERRLLHEIIVRLSSQLPTWLLFDADWIHTRQAVPFLPLLRKIVAVGRVKWIEGSKHTGKDNCAWHLFDGKAFGPTEFVGRAA